MHVKKGELHPEDVESYAEVMRHGKRKHVIAKGNPEGQSRSQRDSKKTTKKKEKVVSSPGLYDGVRQT